MRHDCCISETVSTVVAGYVTVAVVLFLQQAFNQVPFSLRLPMLVLLLLLLQLSPLLDVSWGQFHTEIQ